MLRYKLRTYNVEIALDANNPNTYAPFQFKGKPEDIALIRATLGRSRGAFGHRISEDGTTPIDLDYILKHQMKAFMPQLLEGEELVKV